MTEPEPDKSGPSWGRQTVTISGWKLLGVVLGAGGTLAFIALALAAIPMAMLGYSELRAVLAAGVVLAFMAIVRLVLDLRRLLRVRTRRRRMSARAEDDEDA